MKIIISPAKKMNRETDMFRPAAHPVFLDEAKLLTEWIRALSYEEAKELWRCNDKIAALNYERFQKMDLHKALTPALIAYEGIQYQYMAPEVFTQKEWDYVQEHLRILSGFYGVLKPLDGVVPYRLEMQAKASIGGCRDLYDLWGRRIYEQVRDGSRVILNLASKEYSKCVEKYLTDEDTYITCIFGEKADGRFITKGTYAKMARGEMVRFMAERKIEKPEGAKEFRRLGYVFWEDMSTDTEYIFERMP